MDYFFIYSTCSGFMFAVTSWLWLPSVCSSYVQQTWIWDRKHDSCMRSYSTRMPCVRPFLSIHELSSILTFFFIYILVPYCCGYMVAEYAWVVNTLVNQFIVLLWPRLWSPSPNHPQLEAEKSVTNNKEKKLYRLKRERRAFTKLYLQQVD